MYLSSVVVPAVIPWKKQRSHSEGSALQGTFFLTARCMSRSKAAENFLCQYKNGCWLSANRATESLLISSTDLKNKQIKNHQRDIRFLHDCSEYSSGCQQGVWVGGGWISLIVLEPNDDMKVCSLTRTTVRSQKNVMCDRFQRSLADAFTKVR